MINLSDRAKECLDKYLQQIRTYLRGCKTVDADEVERNVIEHIESEFEGATAAVSFEKLDAVLQRLGSPSQWVPEEDISWWRRVLHRLRTGPEDWRLAYLSFGLLVLGFALPLPLPVLIIASFVVSRAALSAGDGQIQVKAQRWLIYPSLVVVYLVIVCSLLFGVSFLAAPLGYELWTIGQVRTIAQMGEVLFIVSITVTLTALWWTILGIISCRRARLIQSMFKPFAYWFNRKWGVCLMCVGLALLVLSSAILTWLRLAVFSTFK